MTSARPEGAIASLEKAFARYRPIVDGWDDFIAALLRPLPPTIWTNTLRTTPARLIEELGELGLDVEPLSWHPGAFRVRAEEKPGKHWPLVAGLYHIQEEVSLVPARLLEPRPGERVLDLCACPGNKTAQMAVAMENRGTIVANDVDWGRMRALRNSIERLGLFNVVTTLSDGRRFPNEAGRFDRVIVDAPCSCEGTARKSPDVVDELLAGGYRRNVALQKTLLKRAFRLCRPGGRIVYSTCTFAPEENELVVDSLLEDVGDAVEILPARIEGLASSPGITEWDGRKLAPELERTMRIWPHENDSGGFYVALLEKRRDDRAPRTEFPERRSDFHERWNAPDPDPAALDRAWSAVEARFGIPRGALGPVRTFRGKRHIYYVSSEDLLPPAAPEPDAAGVAFLRVNLEYPRLTTAAALHLGHLADRNTLELPLGLLERYFRRETIPIDAQRGSGLDGRGYVIVTHRDVPCGLGFFRPSDQGDGSGDLESYFPKGWGWGLVP